LENAYGHGRALAVWLIEKGCVVKDVNPDLAYDQRKSVPTMKKNKTAYQPYLQPLDKNS